MANFWLDFTSAASVLTTENIPAAADSSTVKPGTALLASSNRAGTTMIARSDSATVASTGTAVVTGAATTAHQDFYMGKWVIDKILSAQDYPGGETTYFTLGLPNESNSSLNVAATVTVYVWRPSTSSIVGYLYDNDTVISAEWAGVTLSSNGAFSSSAVSGIQLGDRLVVELWGHAISSMATSYTAQISISTTSDTCYVQTPPSLVFDLPAPTFNSLVAGDSAVFIYGVPDSNFAANGTWSVRRNGTVLTTTAPSISGFSYLNYLDTTAVNGVSYTYEISYNPQNKWSAVSASVTPKAIALKHSFTGTAGSAIAAGNTTNGTAAGDSPFQLSTSGSTFQSANPVPDGRASADRGTYGKLTGNNSQWYSGTLNGVVGYPTYTSTLWLRAYLKFVSATQVVSVLDDNGASGSFYKFSLGFDTTGKPNWSMQTSSSAAVTWASSSVVSGWARYEVKIDWINSTWEIRIFTNTNLHGTTPDISSGPTAFTSSTFFTNTQSSTFGIGASSRPAIAGTFEIHVDDLAIRGASNTDWIGPSNALILSAAVTESAPAVDDATQYPSVYLLPNTLLTQTGLSGALSTITSNDGTWMTDTAIPQTLRVGFQDPANMLRTGANLQRIRMFLRRGTL